MDRLFIVFTLILRCKRVNVIEIIEILLFKSPQVSCPLCFQLWVDITRIPLFFKMENGEIFGFF